MRQNDFHAHAVGDIIGCVLVFLRKDAGLVYRHFGIVNRRNVRQADGAHSINGEVNAIKGGHLLFVLEERDAIIGGGQGLVAEVAQADVERARLAHLHLFGTREATNLYVVVHSVGEGEVVKGCDVANGFHGDTLNTEADELAVLPVAQVVGQTVPTLLLRVERHLFKGHEVAIVSRNLGDDAVALAVEINPAGSLRLLHLGDVNLGRHDAASLAEEAAAETNHTRIVILRTSLNDGAVDGCPVGFANLALRHFGQPRTAVHTRTREGLHNGCFDGRTCNGYDGLPYVATATSTVFCIDTVCLIRLALADVQVVAIGAVVGVVFRALRTDGHPVSQAFGIDIATALAHRGRIPGEDDGARVLHVFNGAQIGHGTRHIQTHIGGNLGRIAFVAIGHGRNHVGVDASLFNGIVLEGQRFAHGGACEGLHHCAVALHDAGVKDRERLSVDALRREGDAERCIQRALSTSGNASGGSVRCGARCHRHADVCQAERTHVGIAASLHGEVVEAALGRDEVAAEFFLAIVVGDFGRRDDFGVQTFHCGRLAHIGSDALGGRSVAGLDVEVVEVAGFQLDSGQHHIVVGGICLIIFIRVVALIEHPRAAVVVGINDGPVAAVGRGIVEVVAEGHALLLANLHVVGLGRVGSFCAVDSHDGIFHRGLQFCRYEVGVRQFASAIHLYAFGQTRHLVGQGGRVDSPTVDAIGRSGPSDSDGILASIVLGSSLCGHVGRRCGFVCAHVALPQGSATCHVALYGYHRYLLVAGFGQGEGFGHLCASGSASLRLLFAVDINHIFYVAAQALALHILCGKGKGDGAAQPCEIDRQIADRLGRIGGHGEVLHRGQTCNLVIVTGAVVGIVHSHGGLSRGGIYLKDGEVSIGLKTSVPEYLARSLVPASRLIPGENFHACAAHFGCLTRCLVHGIEHARHTNHVDDASGRGCHSHHALGQAIHNVGGEGIDLRIVQGDVAKLVDTRVGFVPEYAIETLLRGVPCQVAGNVVPPGGVVVAHFRKALLGVIDVQLNGQRQLATFLAEILAIVQAIGKRTAAIYVQPFLHHVEGVRVVGVEVVQADGAIAVIVVRVDDATIENGFAAVGFHLGRGFLY